MKFVIGTTAIFRASFYNPDAQPVDLDAVPTVGFFDLNDAPVFVGVPATVIQESPSTWVATIVIPDSTLPDWYKIIWSAAVEGVEVHGEEDFELVEDGFVVINDVERNLRRRLRDALPGSGDDSEAFFMDEEIHSLLALNGRDVIGAAFDGWIIKAAYYSTVVDVNESGSDRKLSQRFKNAQAMAEFYRKLKVGAADDRGKALAGRVVSGRAINLRNDPTDTFGYGYSAQYRASQRSTGAYVRIWPMHRFAGIDLAAAGVTL